MADVASSLSSWSTTASSNSPSGSTTLGAGLDDNLREIQAVIRAALAHKGNDIASGTTTDLGAVAGLFHDITGTTTITGFGTVSAGIHKIVKFEGVLTLTHNSSSLILPGGANITTADGDIGWFVSEGSGNWRCITYFRAGIIPFADASTSVKGVVELATDAETIAGSDTARALTASNLDAVLGFKKLNSGTVSNEATLDIDMTSYTAYKHKRLVMSLVPANDGVGLVMYFSTDGGSSYDSGSENYGYEVIVGGATVTENATGLSLGAGGLIGSAATEGWSGVVDLFDTTDTAKWTRMTFSAVQIDSAATPVVRAPHGGGARRAAQDTDAVRVQFSSGNIASGSWDLYGYN